MSDDKMASGPDDDDEYRLADEPEGERPEESADEPEYELEPSKDGPYEPAPAEFLEVEEPQRKPPPPPPPPPFPDRAKSSAEPPRPGPEEDDGAIFDSAPPRLKPFEAFKFLVWPLRNGNADDFTIVLFVILVILLGGWFVGQLPLVGGTLHAFIAVGTAAYFFTYLVKVARAAAEGRLTPSTWVQAGMDDAGMSLGIRATILLVAYGLPALIVGFATNGAWWAFPFALFAWAAFPAALLNLAASGAMEAANPLDVWRTAVVDRRLYLRILVPGTIFISALFVSSGWLSGVWFGVGMWLTLVYTALAMGLIAFHDDRMAARVAGMSAVIDPENDTPENDTRSGSREEE